MPKLRKSHSKSLACDSAKFDANNFIKKAKAISFESVLGIIRSNGWMVAVHNDYTLNGVFHTFWLFTKDGIAVKGEAKTDVEALNIVYEQIKRFI